jgi:hypothetical protein
MFYYVFKFLAKLFLPLLLKKVVQKLEKILNSSSAMLQDNFLGTSTKDEVILTLQNLRIPEKLKKWVNMLITKK